MIAISRVLALLFRAYRTLARDGTCRTRVLVIHQMLLGDGILLMPLLHALGTQGKQVTIACPAPLIDIYKIFYPQFKYLSFSEKRPSSVFKLLLSGPFGQVVFPFEHRMNRYVSACGASSISSFVAEGSNRSLLIGQGNLPTSPTTMSDMLAELMPEISGMRFEPLNQLTEASVQRSCLLHVDARNPNRRWRPSHWRDLAKRLRVLGFHIVWCFGQLGPEERYPDNSLNDEVFMPQNLREYLDRIRRCALVICPDTGIAHLAKLTSTPSIILYGQGNPALHGNGIYWSKANTSNLFISDVPCRDKKIIVGLHLNWLQRCDREPAQCRNPYCQNDISPEDVIKSIKINFPSLLNI